MPEARKCCCFPLIPVIWQSIFLRYVRVESWPHNKGGAHGSCGPPFAEPVFYNSSKLPRSRQQSHWLPNPVVWRRFRLFYTLFPRDIQTSKFSLIVKVRPQSSWGPPFAKRGFYISSKLPESRQERPEALKSCCLVLIRISWARFAGEFKSLLPFLIWSGKFRIVEGRDLKGRDLITIRVRLTDTVKDRRVFWGNIYMHIFWKKDIWVYRIWKFK